jgi:hypothetical protein
MRQLEITMTIALDIETAAKTDYRRYANLLIDALEPWSSDRDN